MQSVKDSAMELIKKLPDNCTIEDIQYELYSKIKIDAGLSDLAQGSIISEKGMDLEIEKW